MFLFIWGHSSAGRAPAWHAGGQRFESAWLHTNYYQIFAINFVIIILMRCISSEVQFSLNPLQLMH